MGRGPGDEMPHFSTARAETVGAKTGLKDGTASRLIPSDLKIP